MLILGLLALALIVGYELSGISGEMRALNKAIKKSQVRK